MNDSATTNAADPAAVFDAPKPDYGTRLVLYHPNGRGTGAAIQFSVDPATPDRDGAVFFSVARQNAAAGASPDQRFASFDWQNKATVKLNFLEVAEVLMVFGGQTQVLSHAGKDGLYHNSATATTSIELKRSDDPARPGYVLGVGRTPKADPNARQYHTFVFRPAEAVGLRFALQAEMGLLAFGIPRERRVPAPAAAAPAAPAAGAYTPPPAAPAPFPSASAAAPADAGFGTDF